MKFKTLFLGLHLVYGETKRLLDFRNLFNSGTEPQEELCCMIPYKYR